MKFVCVANPVSGKGRSLLTFESLKSQLEGRGHQVTLLKTHADPTVFRRHCENLDPQARVVVIGGDGTLAHFLDCCAHFHGVTLFGQGTANVVSIEFDIPRKLEAFVTMLEADRRVTIRPIEAEDRTPIVMMYSAGIDGSVLNNTSQTLKNKIGKVAFLFSALKTLASYRYPPFTVRCDDQPAQTVSFAIATRFRHYAGPYVLAPTADQEDDRIHVVALRKGGLAATVRFFWHLFRGTLTNHPHVWQGSGQTIRFDYSDRSILGQKDGDACPPYSVLKPSDRRISLIVP